MGGLTNLVHLAAEACPGPQGQPQQSRDASSPYLGTGFSPGATGFQASGEYHEATG